jgi:cytochrome c553
MADVAAFYASKTAPQGAIAEDQKDLAAEGEKIFKGGLAKGNIPSCMSCHGPAGLGIPNHYPRVAGQHAKYLEVQLLAFKKGERKGYNNMMSDISFGLSEQQIKALAVYMSGLN